MMRQQISDEYRQLQQAHFAVVRCPELGGKAVMVSVWRKRSEGNRRGFPVKIRCPNIAPQYYGSYGKDTRKNRPQFMTAR